MAKRTLPPASVSVQMSRTTVTPRSFAACSFNYNILIKFDLKFISEFYFDDGVQVFDAEGDVFDAVAVAHYVRAQGLIVGFVRWLEDEDDLRSKVDYVFVFLCERNWFEVKGRIWLPYPVGWRARPSSGNRFRVLDRRPVRIRTARRNRTPPFILNFNGI